MRAGCSLSVAVALVAGCSNSDRAPPPAAEAGGATGAAGAGAGGAGALEIEGFEVVENPSNVLSYFVDWQTSLPAGTHLVVDCGADYTQRFEQNEPSSDHSVFVMGLFSGAECRFTATATVGDDTVTASETLSVGPLPDFLPVLSANGVDESRMEPGWTLTNLSKLFDDKPPLIVALVDPAGRYRWYVQHGSDPGADTDVRTVPEGVLIGGTRIEMDPAIVSWQGSVVWTEHISMDHDIQPWGEPGQYLYLSNEAVGCADGFEAGVINHYDRNTDEMLWQWRHCEHYTPSVVEWDWSHTNAVVPYPDGEAMLLSTRDQNQIQKIDLASEEITWRLGIGGDFTLPSGAEFYRQHAAELEPNGNILLYDNGLSGQREWSRAVELGIDETTMTARVEWEFRPSPDIFTPIWGDADRMANGNTLITFGRTGESDDSHIIEVAPDGSEVWHLVTPPKWGWYRAQRVRSPPLGEVLSGL